MSSADGNPPGGGLAGIFSFGAGPEEECVRMSVSQAAGVRGGEAVIDGEFAVACASGLHRRGDFLCALQGRLANYDSLSSRLGLRAGAPPTEVAAAACVELGRRAVAELRGEYVLVLWDTRARSGLIARDHLGTRTMFVHASASRLMFASDVKCLLGLLPSRPNVDALGVVEWLVLGAVADGRTLHTGVCRLQPGTELRFDRHGWSQERYWRPRYAAPLEISRDEAAAELRAGLRRTVSSQLGRAGSAGVLLSGGLDSTTVAAMAHEVLCERDEGLVGYSMTFPKHPQIDESHLIRTVSDHLAIPSTQMQVLGGSMLRGGLEFLSCWQLPTPAPNTVFITAIQRYAAGEGIELMLDGEGGDELFGVDSFVAASNVRRGDVLAAWRVCQQIPGLAQRPRRELMRAFSVLALRGAAPYWMAHLRRSRRHPHERAPGWLSSASAHAFAESHDPWTWKRSSAPLWWSHLSHTLSVGREEMWVFDCLRQLGIMSGIERRHPLLDVELVELVLRLPPEYAYDAHLDRALARRAMTGRLPNSVTARSDKSFFTALVRESLLGADLAVVRRLLESPDAEIRRFVDPPQMSRLLDAASSAREPPEFAIQAWRLVMVECWLRSQTDADFADSLIESAALAPPQVEFAVPSSSPRSTGMAAA